MKVEFSRQIYKKHANIKFHENLSRGSRVVPYEMIDKHDKANSRFRQLDEIALTF